MSRGGGRSKLSADEVVRHNIWQSTSADSGASQVEEWDIKQSQLADAVLGVLAQGDAITFGVTRTGLAVSVTISSGDDRVRKYADDSIALDDITAWILQTVAQSRLRHIPTKTTA